MNYESYLKLMSCLVFVLTDEHPEIRRFTINMGLNSLFNKSKTIKTPVLAGCHLRDSNEKLTI